MEKRLAARIVVLVLLGSVAVAAAGGVNAAPVQWPLSEGGNGHFYEFVPAGQVTWDEARSAAAGRTFGVRGHLATLTSDAEWQFAVYRSGFADDSIDMAWIGGAQAPGARSPSAGWYWVTGEPFEFAPWGRFFWNDPEPNDLGGGRREMGNEDYLALFGRGFATGLNGNPIFGMFNDEGGTRYIGGYIVEYPVPEPSAPTFLAAAAALVLCRRPSPASC